MHISSVMFYDIGAITYYLKAIPWLIENFSSEKYWDALWFILRRIEHDGYYEVLNHRFVITAENNK